MKWEGREESENVEDRRGIGTAGAVAGGGGVVALVVYMLVQFLGGDEQQAKQMRGAAQDVDVAPLIERQIEAANRSSKRQQAASKR